MKTTMNTNYRIMENEKDFEKITAYDTPQYYEYKDYSIRVERVHNDYYGNPLYHVTIWKDFENMTYHFSKHCSLRHFLVYRTYIKQGFCTVQSYSIGDTVKRMVSYLDKVTLK